MCYPNGMAAGRWRGRIPCRGRAGRRSSEKKPPADRDSDRPAGDSERL